MNWRPHYHKRIIQIIDFITIIVSYFMAFELWGLAYKYIPWQSISAPVNYDLDLYLVLPLLTIGYIWLLNYLGAYSLQRFTVLLNESAIILKGTVIWMFFSTFILYMLSHVFIHRSYLILEFVIVLVLLYIQKISMFYLAHWIRKRGFNRRKVVVIGSEIQTNVFIETIERKFNWGFDIIGVVVGESNNSGEMIRNHKVLGSYNEIDQILKKFIPDEVIITISSKEVKHLSAILEVCLREGIPVRINSDFFDYLSKDIQIDRIYGLNIISINTVYQTEIQLFIKRVIDIVGSITAILIFFPLMIIATAGILITDGGPVFYTWRVVGRNKRPFRSWKFRTMVIDADKLKDNLKAVNEMEGPVFKITNDPRIIPFGRWLRRYSIDETPQLFSVLKGDMSLVGPRPAGPHELDQYESWHRRKLSIKPGITCLWQVSGRNSITNFDDWVRLDLQYIDNWSIWLDLKIIFKTILTVLNANGK